MICCYVASAWWRFAFVCLCLYWSHPVNLGRRFLNQVWEKTVWQNMTPPTFYRYESCKTRIWMFVRCPRALNRQVLSQFCVKGPSFVFFCATLWRQAQKKRYTPRTQVPHLKTTPIIDPDLHLRPPSVPNKHATPCEPLPSPPSQACQLF